jgi:hypothetical protein
VCGMVGMLCMGLCLKKSAFSLSPSSSSSERGEKKGEMRSHRVRGGAGQAHAGQCQDCAGDAEEGRMVGAGLARPPAAWPSEVGAALGASGSEVGAL